MADITPISSDTSINSFPKTYNSNNETLLKMINDLQEEIAKLKKSHTEDVNNLNSLFDQWKTTHENEFDKKNDGV